MSKDHAESRKFHRIALSIWALLPALVLAVFARPAAAQTMSDWIRLPGHQTRAAATAWDIGVVAPSETIPLTIGLAPRDPQGLDEFLSRVYDPQDPLYHHFLTPTEFTARFSPTPAEYAAVAAYARAQGLTITGTTSDRLLLHVQAPSATVEDAFGVHLHRLVDAGERVFHAPDAEPSVPAGVASLLTGIVGLDNSLALHPHLRRLEPSVPALFPQSAPSLSLDGARGILPEAASALPSETGSGPGGGLTPTDIRTAYNLNGAGLSGAGQTLALFELDSYVQSDISAYESSYGLPNVTVTPVTVDGGSGALNSSGGQAEVTLDIELQLALAPGASQILVYEGPNTGQGLLDTYSKIASDNLAKQVSTSWGLDEPDMGASFIRTESTYFKKMAAQGQTIFAAAGDSGAYDNGRTLSVDDPASQPYVTGAGGTSLTTSGAGGAWKSETTWGGGGGGVSAVWSLPTWQQGVVSTASQGSTTMRNVPDVSLDADPNTGYSIFVQGGWAIYGGTSCAAPLWAAYTALVNQQRVTSGLSVLGYANPILYAAAQGPYGSRDFRDITSGSNGYYPAVAGYDDATGWGTLNGINLLADLAPPAPSGLTAAATSTSQINLTWSTVPNAVSYSVLRGTASGGPYAQIGSTTGTSYTDTGVTSGTTYYYVVTASTAAATSANSNEASTAPVGQQAQPQTEPVYRLYKAEPNGYDFILTISPAAVTADQNMGYNIQFVIGYAPSSAVGTIPLYETYSPSRADHFYTTSASERDAVLSFSGSDYQNDGTVFQLLTTGGSGTLALHRLYNPSTGRHVEPANDSEYHTLINSGQWNDEGILGYLNASP